MDPFVDQLASLCRDQVTRAKWVFVPTHAVGRTIGERIALGGTNWLNLRFVTPLDIALRMGAPFLVERGIEPSEEGLGPALMMRLLLDLPLDGGYFRPLADQPTMAQALWTTVRELRLAGVKSDQVQPEAFESSAKHTELRALLAAYEQFLVTTKRGDMATVYEEAVQHPGWCPIQPEDCWTELPDAIWTHLQAQLIHSMPGERILPRALEIPGASTPRRLDHRKVERITPDVEMSPLAFLLTPASDQCAIGTSDVARGQQPVVRRAPPVARNVSLFRAGGREAEVEEVFRRILHSGVPLDLVEIACASSDYATLFWDKACRHDWPKTIGTGLPAALTRPGRALLAWCDWIEGRFAAVDLRHMLESGDLAVETPTELTPGRAARLLARSEATWGRDTYQIALTRLTREYQDTADDEERSAESREIAQGNAGACEALGEWVIGLQRMVPEADAEGRLPLLDVISAAVFFAENCCDTTSALDGAVRKALLEELLELKALRDLRCSPTQALGFVRDRVGTLTIARDRARPGHLHIASLSQTGYAGRPFLFVVGLQEGRVFPPAVEDPVLLDIERVAISPLLRLSSDRTDEAVYSVLSRLAACGDVVANRGSGVSEAESGVPGLEDRVLASVTFSYSSLDTRQYRESLPSWLMLRAARLVTGDPSLSYDGLLKYLGDPVSCVPPVTSTAVSEAGWWLSGLKVAPEAGHPHVLSSFPHVARGIEAAEDRASNTFTHYDGLVPAAGAALDPVAHSYAVSVSTLQDAAKCPQSYFIKRCLRVEPIHQADPDRDAWLDHLLRGNELHAMYAELMRRCRSEGRRPNATQDAWILLRAEERLQELSREMPPPSQAVFERERADFLRDVELFVGYEAAVQGREPVGLEVSFGRSYKYDSSEALARPTPISIPLGGGRELLLNGRIDRIDRVGPSRYEVIDYKTGRYKSDEWKGTFAGGTRLQYALYAVAADELLRQIDTNARVERGVYLFTSARGGQHPAPFPVPSRSQIAAVLDDLLAVIASGVFIHTTDKDDCRYCDFGPACGQGATERAAAKVKNLGESRLDCCRRLATHA